MKLNQLQTLLFCLALIGQQAHASSLQEDQNQLDQNQEDPDLALNEPFLLSRFQTLREPKIDLTYTCPEEDGIFGRAEDCRSFHWCDKGVAYLDFCPPFTSFDARAQLCLQERRVSWQEAAVFTCPRPNERFRDPTSCNRFFICKNGNPTLQYCDYSQKFDVPNKLCVPESGSRCDLAPITTTEAPTTTLRWIYYYLTCMPNKLGSTSPP